MVGSSDQQIIVSPHQVGYRVIYQYRSEQATLDLRNIEKQVAKANQVIRAKVPAFKTIFLSIKADHKQLNQKLIDKAWCALKSDKQEPSPEGSTRN
ncbi:MAG: hypothetical protein WAN58_15855 [Anaerolineales bacterium]